MQLFFWLVYPNSARLVTCTVSSDSVYFFFLLPYLNGDFRSNSLQDSNPSDNSHTYTSMHTCRIENLPPICFTPGGQHSAMIHSKHTTSNYVNAFISQNTWLTGP